MKKVISVFTTVMAKTRGLTRGSEDPEGVGVRPGKKRSKTTLHEKVMHDKSVEEEDFDRSGGGAYIAPAEMKRLREVGYAVLYAAGTVEGSGGGSRLHTSHTTHAHTQIR